MTGFGLAEKNNKDFSFLENDFLCLDSVVGVCGIASPETFKIFIKRFFKNIKKTFFFDDHYVYNKTAIQPVLQTLTPRGPSVSLVTTRKDYVKIKPFIRGFSVYIIDVKHKIDDVKNFKKVLKTRVCN